VNLDASAALDRALRRTFQSSGGGKLRDDLAAAIVEAAADVAGSDEEYTVDLNDVFGLRLNDPWLDLPVEDAHEAIAHLAETFVFEDDLFEAIQNVGTGCSLITSSPCGIATMMSDAGISVFEFTIDDTVYFFTYAEPDVCEMEWWSAHTVGDLAARASAIESVQTMIGYESDEAQ
jgi:hypothetical protein